MKFSIEFTGSEMMELHSIARGVWEYIGHDTLQCVAEEKSKNINAVSITRAEVIELVLDAGRFEDHMKRNKRLRSLVDRWMALDYKQQQKAIIAAFPFDRYGM